MRLPPDDNGVPPEPDDWHLFEPPMEEEAVNTAGMTHQAEPLANPVASAASKELPASSEPALPANQVVKEEEDELSGSNLLFAGTPLANVHYDQPDETSDTTPVSSPPAPLSRGSLARPPVDPQSPPYLSMPFFVMPSPANTGTPATGETQPGDDYAPRMLTVILRSSSDKERDVRRLRRIHGLLRSYPGRDKFSLLVFEGGRRFLLEFPNDTTGICSELIRKLIELVGEGNVNVESIKIQ
jgi:hypothetical protein